VKKAYPSIVPILILSALVVVVAAVAIERPAALPVLGYLAPVLASVIVAYMNRK